MLLGNRFFRMVHITCLTLVAKLKNCKREPNITILLFVNRYYSERNQSTKQGLKIKISRKKKSYSNWKWNEMVRWDKDCQEIHTTRLQYGPIRERTTRLMIRKRHFANSIRWSVDFVRNGIVQFVWYGFCDKKVEDFGRFVYLCGIRCDGFSAEPVFIGLRRIVCQIG